MKIYTKKGDQGYTSNVKGERIHKGELLMELQGSIDEVNAGVGYLRSIIKRSLSHEEKESLDISLKEIQYILFKMGSDVSSIFERHYVKEEEILFLEESIDLMTEKTGELKNFIYYNGNEAAAYCQLIRCVTRRAERVFGRVIVDKDFFAPDYQYMNRLADYFFTMGRYLNFLGGDHEEVMTLR